MNPKNLKTLIFSVVILVLVIFVTIASMERVPAGHVSVATLFGKVHPEPYHPGLHFPVNPLLSWTRYDTRQKTHMETVNVPSQDQLTTQIDISVQLRVIAERAPHILANTGTFSMMRDVHVIPTLRSAVREQAKSIPRAEDFFIEQTQNRLQSSVLEHLNGYLIPRGMRVEAVLLRDIRLPEFILAAIEQKKEREQAAERQKAELARFRTEQQQKVEQARAEREAAEEQATRIRILAQAEAERIRIINEASADSPAYLTLMGYEALAKIATDPAAKLYFFGQEARGIQPALPLLPLEPIPTRTPPTPKPAAD